MVLTTSTMTLYYVATYARTAFISIKAELENLP